MKRKYPNPRRYDRDALFPGQYRFNTDTHRWERFGGEGWFDSSFEADDEPLVYRRGRVEFRYLMTWCEPLMEA
jgi:hypothetical protein